jgi:hypothetical protein
MLRSEGSFAAFKILTLSCGVYLLTEDIELDQILPPGPTHIFILPRKVDEGCLLLFMQEVDTHLVKAYRLVVCCRCYEIGFTSSERLDFQEFLEMGPSPLSGTFRETDYVKLDQSLYDVLDRIWI